VLPTESKSVDALKKWVMIQESYGYKSNNNNYYFFYYWGIDKRAPSRGHILKMGRRPEERNYYLERRRKFRFILAPH